MIQSNKNKSQNYVCCMSQVVLKLGKKVYKPWGKTDSQG